MPEATQICVGLENKPGMLAKLCEVLRLADVNLLALFVSDDEECCWVNLIADPSPMAERTLGEAGYKHFTEKVLTVRIGRLPGELESIASRLADSGINIDYVYGGTGGPAGGSATLVLHVSDQEKALSLLNEE